MIQAGLSGGEIMSKTQPRTPWSSLTRCLCNMSSISWAKAWQLALWAHLPCLFGREPMEMLEISGWPQSIMRHVICDYVRRILCSITFVRLLEDLTIKHEHSIQKYRCFLANSSSFTSQEKNMWMMISKVHPHFFVRVGNYETVPGKFAELLFTPHTLATVMQKNDDHWWEFGVPFGCIDMFGHTCPISHFTQLYCRSKGSSTFYASAAMWCLSC